MVISTTWEWDWYRTKREQEEEKTMWNKKKRKKGASRKTEMLEDYWISDCQ